MSRVRWPFLLFGGEKTVHNSSIALQCSINRRRSDAAGRGARAFAHRSLVLGRWTTAVNVDFGRPRQSWGISYVSLGSLLGSSFGIAIPGLSLDIARRGLRFRINWRITHSQHAAHPRIAIIFSLSIPHISWRLSREITQPELNWILFISCRFPYCNFKIDNRVPVIDGAEMDTRRTTMKLKFLSDFTTKSDICRRR
jgi:hypothetical protein